MWSLTASIFRNSAKTVGALPRGKSRLRFPAIHLVPYLTALENVMLAQYFHSVTDEKQAGEALKRVGLGDRPDAPPRATLRRRTAARGHRAGAYKSPKIILATSPPEI